MSIISSQRTRFPVRGAAQEREPGETRWNGVSGNAALTALSSVLLLVLLAMEGFTVLSVPAMFTAHVFLGLILVPPILLKLASVGYRFVRYYSGSARYRAAGPPHPLPRVLGPFVVFATVALFASGIMLLVVGPSSGEVWRRLHIAAFLVWFCLMSLHVLLHLRRAPTLALADIRRLHSGGSRLAVSGPITRQSLVIASLVLGLVLAIVALPLDATWLHWLAQVGPGQ